MTLRKIQLAACVSALALAACGEETGAPPAQSPAPEQMSPQTGAPVPMMQPTAAAPNPPAMTPTGASPVTMVQPNAQPSGAAGAAPTEPVKPNEPAMPAGMDQPAARPGDTCTDRRVSYAKPCTSEPDPCGIKSGWPGDEYCLKPPPEGEGIQIHVGPDDYKNMAEVSKYVIKAGEEFNNSVIGHIPLTENKFFNRITVHMRPGSHHWISTVVSGKPTEQFYNDTGCGSAMSIGSLGGGQNLIYDNPPAGKPAPENEGLGRTVPGNSSLCMNLHAYNFSDNEQLREMWINIYFVDEAKVTQKASGIGFVGGLGLNLAPGASKEQTYTATFDKPGRIIQLFGHRHVWTPRFAAWLNDRLVYDSWSWEESATFNYDSLTMNPPINTEGKVDGAVSGILDVKAGDKLKFTCYVENKSKETLRFSNELYGGEMCNLWGSAVGTGISGQGF